MLRLAILCYALAFSLCSAFVSAFSSTGFIRIEGGKFVDSKCQEFVFSGQLYPTFKNEFCQRSEPIKLSTIIFLTCYCKCHLEACRLSYIQFRGQSFLLKFFRVNRQNFGTIFQLEEAKVLSCCLLRMEFVACSGVSCWSAQSKRDSEPIGPGTNRFINSEKQFKLCNKPRTFRHNSFM